MKKFFTLFLLIFFFNQVFSQTQGIYWQKSLGGSSDDYLSKILKTDDGGYILLGQTKSNNYDVSGNHGNFDIWVVKMDNNFDIIWQKCLGGSNLDEAVDIKITDSGYIIVGNTKSNDGDVSGLKGDKDIWIVKLTNNGSIQWQKCFGGTNEEYASSIHITPTGNYIISGTTKSFDGDIIENKGFEDIWVFSVNNSGELLWQRTFGGNSLDISYNSIPTSDEGYAIVGWTFSNDGDISQSYGDGDVWLIKLNSLGQLQWEKSYGGERAEIGVSIFQQNNGSYLIGALSSSTTGDNTCNNNEYDRQVWILKTTGSGELSWNSCYGGNDWEFLYNQIQTSDGGSVFVGYTESHNLLGYQGNYDSYVLKIKSNGQFDWYSLFGGSNYDYAKSVVELPEGNLLIAGNTNSNNGDVQDNKGAYDIWLIKIGILSQDAGISYLNVGQQSCEISTNSFNPIVTLSNTGISTTLNSVEFSYQIDNQELLYHTWNGNLTNGEAETISLPEIHAEPGNHIYTLNITKINGANDEGSSNNSLSQNFQSQTFNTNKVMLEITFDGAPEEISWTFENGNGDIMYQGENYTEPFTHVSIPLNLPPITDCYTFTIHDSFGDGLCCENGIGSWDLFSAQYQIIEYGLSNFGSSAYFQFENDGILSVIDSEKSKISIYPNPATNKLYFENLKSPSTVKILNAEGKIIVEKTIQPSGFIDISALPKGVYVAVLDGNSYKFIKN